MINVHNPTNGQVEIGKKAAGGLTERATGPGKISQIRSLVLVPDQDLMIDCKDVKSLLGGVQPNGDGVVVILSTASLDVWAAYTMRGASTTSAGENAGLNGNIDVVQVPERRTG